MSSFPLLWQILLRPFCFHRSIILLYDGERYTVPMTFLFFWPPALDPTDKAFLFGFGGTNVCVVVGRLDDIVVSFVIGFVTVSGLGRGWGVPNRILLPEPLLLEPTIRFLFLPENPENWTNSLYHYFVLKISIYILLSYFIQIISYSSTLWHEITFLLTSSAKLK